MGDVEQQEALAHATHCVQEAQQKRDICEMECAGALHGAQCATARSAEHSSGAAKTPAWSRGLTQLRSLLASPLVQHQDEKLALERRRIERLKARARVAKDIYSKSLQQLDQISTVMHIVRLDSAASSASVDATTEGPPATNHSLMLSPFELPEYPVLQKNGENVPEQLRPLVEKGVLGAEGMTEGRTYVTGTH